MGQNNFAGGVPGNHTAGSGWGFFQGHRGCRGLMPENTVPAFLKALDLGITILELDVVITQDSQVLVSHEEFFNHEISTWPDGRPVTEAEEHSLNIYKMNYNEVRQFDVGKKTHPRFATQHKMAVHKPLLKEVFDSVAAYCKARQIAIPYYNIEIKSLPATDHLFHPRTDRFVGLVMAEIIAAGLEEKVILQSFDYRPLQYLHQHYPHIKLAALVEDYDKQPFEKQLELLGFTPTAYSPAYQLVTPLLVRQCKAKGVQLIPWTVNDPNDMRRLIEMGVDGIITDYPDRRP